MAVRSIDGPEKDWLDMADLTKLLRLSESTIKRLVDSGEFPSALEPTPGTRMWSWRDVLYWQLRVEMRPRLEKKVRRKGSSLKPVVVRPEV